MSNNPIDFLREVAKARKIKLSAAEKAELRNNLETHIQTQEGRGNKSLGVRAVQKSRKSRR